MSFRDSRRLVALALLGGGALSTVASVQAQPVPVPLQRWNYTVKFVCGLQRPIQAPGETIVKPANYATEVNILNPFPQQNPVRKRVILLVDQGKAIGREPEQQGPRGFDWILLKPGFATMDDCNRLWQLTHPTLPLPMPMPLTIGFLTLESPRELDVDAVYTAGTPGFSTGADLPQGISIDVERVPGRRLPVIFTPVPTDPVPAMPDAEPQE